MLRSGVPLLLGALLSAMVACTPDGTDPPGPTATETDPPLVQGSGTLRVLAGSELEDLRRPGGILDAVREATGVDVQLSYIGTLDGMDQVISGEAAENFDAIWFSTNRYLDLQPGARERVLDPTPIMVSPVIIGVRESVAAQHGWDTDRPSWAEIAAVAGAGGIGFAMSNPATSNSGFCALVGVTAAVTGAPDTPPTLDDARAAEPQLRSLFSAQRLSSGSSGWVAEGYLSRADQPELNALINYESVLLSLDALDGDRALPEPLTPVYPSDGAVVADYPLTLLAGASEQARQNHLAVTSYLLQQQTQREIMTQTYRRPIRPVVGLAAEFDRGRDVTALPFPDQREVADALIAAYSSTLRRPARTIYVLDVSGSMLTELDPNHPDQGTRLDALQAVLRGLTRADESLSSQVTVFQERETVVLLPFSTGVGPAQRFDVPAGEADPTLADIQVAVDGLEAAGDTALYDALLQAYEIAGEPAEDEPYTTIVLLSDGEQNVGVPFDGDGGFAQRFADLPPAQRGVPVFPVVLGEAEAAEMDELARLTGGRLFDARSVGSLAAVFREIRGYQ